eukprot:502685-Pelagomonas_calceolata.AAC.1
MKKPPATPKTGVGVLSPELSQQNICTSAIFRSSQEAARLPHITKQAPWLEGQLCPGIGQSALAMAPALYCPLGCSAAGRRGTQL